MIHNIPQPTFEQFVANRLARDGIVEIRRNHSFVSCMQVCDARLPSKIRINRASSTMIELRLWWKIVTLRRHTRFAPGMLLPVMELKAESERLWRLRVKGSQRVRLEEGRLPTSAENSPQMTL
jgi:hypothetical protein